MMMYLDDLAYDQYKDEFTERMTEFMEAISNKDAMAKCISIIDDVNKGQYYGAYSARELARS